MANKINEFGVREISNSELTANDIPGADADWLTIGRFALSFDGYEVHGSSEACAKIANSRRAGTLRDLRTCLFFEQRRWRHFAEEPDREAMEYIRSLVEQIRDRVLTGDVA